MRILVLLVLAVNAAMAADIPLRPANSPWIKSLKHLE